MVNYSDRQLGQIFSALSDSTRRAMLFRLADEEMSVADLSKPFHMRAPLLIGFEPAIFLFRNLRWKTSEFAFH